MNTLVKQLFEKPFETLNVSSKDFDKFFIDIDELRNNKIESILIK